MKRFPSSPLKLLGLLTIVIGLFGTILTLGYLIVSGFIFIGVGLTLLLIDFLSSNFLKNKKAFWSVQISLATAYLILGFVAFMKWQKHNAIIFPNGFKGEAGIVFGVEGFPELPDTKLWKKTIIVPANGIIITSTKVEDIPNTIRFSFKNKTKLDFQQIDWNPNFELDCITCGSKIKSWIFRIGNAPNTPVKNLMTDLCDLICKNQRKSVYKSDNSVLWSDDEGKYLWLQDRGLSTLPSGLGKLDIHKVILTGNEFTDLPPQILEIDSLQELILAANPIKKFPCELQKLKKLKSISIAATQIREIECDLSKFDSLTDFDMARNNLLLVPSEINKIPNLTWLSLTDNLLNSLSFIDTKLEKLEVLNVYTNKIKSISNETKYLPNLKELLIFDNEIDSISMNISNLKQLEKLEIWDNPVKYISPEIKKLTKLRTMRLDDDYLTQTDKNNLKNWLPNCEINYQTRSKK